MAHPILDLFEAAAEQRGDRLSAADATLMLDYRALRAVACGLAGRSAAATERPHVGLVAPTSAAGAAAILACWYAGRTPVPLSPLLTPEELRTILADAEIDLVITIERFAAPLAAAGVQTLMLDATTLAPGRRAAPAARGEDLGVLLYTSGTSGAPKGVRLSMDNLARNAAACIEHERIEPDQVFVSPLPQFHSFGFTAMTVVPLTLGATVWYLPRFSPLSVVSMIAERGATAFMGVASMYAAMTLLRDAPPDALRTLRLAISGGEALPARVAEAFRQRFGVEILEGYGLTETSPVVSINTPWALRPGSVGQPLPGVEVFAADEAGAALGAGELGELHIRGHCVMQGYHRREVESASAMRGGALRTGDLGLVDADGYVHIRGRARDMIIVAGENIMPAQIEEALLAHPAVAEAAVIGVPDELRGEAPVAFVILREGAKASGADLRAACRERLAVHKVPREVRVCPELPRGPTGKILKRALRGLLEGVTGA